MRKILITGGAGFIASNFIPYFLKVYPDYELYNVDLLTYAGNLSNLDEVKSNPRYQFLHGDISDRGFVMEIFEKYRFDAVIHFAAESHVDNSISDPTSFATTNVIGTLNLLEAARKLWFLGNHKPKPEFIQSRFHHISTDEVFGSLGQEGFFNEDSKYAPNNPYSASKASADMFVRAYQQTYGLNTVITNCSNNYGPKQHDEKLIPTIIRKALAGEKIPIYGRGENIRDWLYVEDHCRGVDCVFHHGVVGETYNIGGHNELSNYDIATKICDLLNEMYPSTCDYNQFITFVEDRPGHDYRYAVDTTKIETELAWKSKEDFTQGLRKTIHWYSKKYMKDQAAYEN